MLTKGGSTLSVVNQYLSSLGFWLARFHDSVLNIFPQHPAFLQYRAISLIVDRHFLFFLAYILFLGKIVISRKSLEIRFFLKRRFFTCGVAQQTGPVPSPPKVSVAK